MVTVRGARPGTSLEVLTGYFALALRSEGKSPKTVSFLMQHLRLFRGYACSQGWEDIRDVDAWALRQFLAYVRDPENLLGTRRCPRAHGPTRAFHHYKALRAFFDFLKRERLILEYPLENVRLRCPPPQNLSVYSQEELARINRLCALDFKVAPTKKSRAVAARNHALFLAVLDTGLRLAELAGLLVDDVDPETGVIRVRRGKGGKGRLVRVGQESRRCLMRYLAHRIGESPQLWLSQEGKPLTVHGVEQVFDRLCHRADVKFRGVHAFRRSWCAAAIRNGANLRMVQLLGGWSTLA
ncbi:MAG: tyrosine-type recombinase/integrase, partial [Dehalococcoidia bacterium]